MKENPGIILRNKKNYLEWKEYVTILLESKGLESTINNQENFNDTPHTFGFIQSNEKEKKGKSNYHFETSY
eukprot:snap_masked-scaffold_57-processed-gene-0.24-mRNA-1 protein AED:1.00 eAED:1.00 QI:0/-1/0/0/-1/1/1/0/70